MFTLKIETDNAAFEDDPKDEIIRILKDVIEYMDDGMH